MKLRCSLFLLLSVLSIVLRLTAAQLGLPPSSGDQRATSLDLSAVLGPIVINADGSTSRIANWPDLTPAEQERTKRRIVERNRRRLKEIRGKSGDEIESPTRNSDEL